MPNFIVGSALERVSSFKFLAFSIPDDPSWAQHIDVIMKAARQLLRFLRSLETFSRSLERFKSLRIL